MSLTVPHRRRLRLACLLCVTLGLAFFGWGSNPFGPSGSILFTVAEAAAIPAREIFQPPATVTVRVTGGEHGRVEPRGTVLVPYNAHLKLTAGPDEGYVVDRWTVDGRIEQYGGETITLTFLQSEHEVRVTFKRPSIDGQIYFNNRIPGSVDARATLPTGGGLGEGFTAQLWAWPAGSPSSEMLPLFPTTTFRTSPPAARGYVHPVVVTVPNVPPGNGVYVVMRIFNGRTFETSTIRGQSMPIFILVGGGLVPPTYLVGLSAGFFALSPSLRPVIDQSPFSQRVVVGDTIALNVVARDANPPWMPAFFYQWYFNDLPIPGARGPSLIVTNVQFSHAGRYSVSVSNHWSDLYGGPVKSAAATVTVAAASKKGDLNGDGQPDLVFQNDDSFLAVWLMQRAAAAKAEFLWPQRTRDPDTRLVAACDFDRDGQQDLLFQRQDGLEFWHMNGLALRGGARLMVPQTASSGWQARATGDLDGDRREEIIFQRTDGTLAAWHLDGVKPAFAVPLEPNHPGDPAWRVVGCDDFSADGKADLLFQHTDGTLAVWVLDGPRLRESFFLQPSQPGAAWRVASVADFDTDGSPDIVFQHDDDLSLAVWFMSGIRLRQSQLIDPANPGNSWRVRAP